MDLTTILFVLQTTTERQQYFFGWSNHLRRREEFVLLSCQKSYKKLDNPSLLFLESALEFNYSFMFKVISGSDVFLCIAQHSLQDTIKKNMLFKFKFSYQNKGDITVFSLKTYNVLTEHHVSYQLCTLLMLHLREKSLYFLTFSHT